MENKPENSQDKKTNSSDLSSFMDPFRHFVQSIRDIFTFKQHVMGIDIGYSYLKIAQLAKTKKGYILTGCLTRAIPTAIRDNAVEKRKVLQGYIKEFMSATASKTNIGRIVLWGKGVFLLSFTLPMLNKRDLRGAVTIELKKRIPFQTDLNNIAFDFFVADQVRDERSSSFQITCIACDRILIEEQLQFLKELDIQPVGINVIPDVLGNLLAHCINAKPDSTAAVLDMGANASILNFYKGRSLVFSREVPVGGEHITKAMVRVFPTPSGPVEITPEEAEKIKCNCGIPLAEEAKIDYVTDVVGLRGEQIATMLRPVLEKLVMEINRTISYYGKMFRTEKLIEEMYITGGASRIRNIEQFFQFNLQGIKKASSLNTLKVVASWADMDFLKSEMVMEQAASYLGPALGVAIEEGGRVNLLPMREKIEIKLLSLMRLLKILLPVILSLVLLFAFIHWGNVVRYRKFVADIDAGLARLAPITSGVKEYQSIKEKLEQRKNLLEKAKEGQPFWYGILKEISNLTPKEIVLQKIYMEAKDPKEIHLAGKVFTKYTIVDVVLSQYEEALGGSPFFRQVNQASNKPDLFSPIPSASFEIVCKLKY